MINIEYSLTLGNIAEMCIIAGGGLIAFGVMQRTVKDIEAEVSKMQEQLHALGNILTKIAVQDNRLKNVEEDIRELRHGRGWAFPPPSMPEA